LGLRTLFGSETRRGRSSSESQPTNNPSKCSELAPAPEHSGGPPVRTRWCGGNRVQVFDASAQGWRDHS
jgi:hypothetical protein